MKKTGKTSFRTLLFLWAILLGACLLIFHNYILGKDTMVFSDIGSDTKQQYIMWYNGFANMIRSGRLSLWDFRDGFGINLYNLNLFEPFLLLVYAIGAAFGPDKIAMAMVYIQILKILLAGTFCYFLLSEYSRRESAKLLACLMYAFNGYLMIWGQHYQMGTSLVFLPLLFLFIEKTIRNRRWVFALIPVTSQIMLNGFYHAYMSLLAAGIYVTIRVLLYQEGTFKERLKIFVTEALAMVAGLVMGAINLLPAINSTVGASSRLDIEESVFSRIIHGFSPWEKEYYRSAFYRLFGNNLQGAGNDFVGYANYYEAANLFFSTLFVILLVQFALTIHKQKVSVRAKLAQYLGILAVAFILIVPAGSLAFNGFAYAFSRETFVFMPLFAMMSCYVLHQIFSRTRFSYVGLLLTFVGLIGVYGVAYKNMNQVIYKSNALILMLTGLGMCVVLSWIYRGKKIQSVTVEALTLLLFVNIISDVSLCYRYRETVKKDDTSYFQETYHSATNEAIAWIYEQDPTMFRMEKDYRNAGYSLEGLAQNYAGVSTYNPTQNKNIIEFVKKLWPKLLRFDRNHLDILNGLYENTRQSLVGMKYLLSHDQNLHIDGYEKLKQIGNVTIYENKNFGSFGKFFTKITDDGTFEATSKDLDLDKLMSEVLILEDAGEEGLSAGDLTEDFSKVYIKGVDYQVKEETGVLTVTLTPSATKGREETRLKFRLNSAKSGNIDVTIDGEPSVGEFQMEQKNYNYDIRLPQNAKTIVISCADRSSKLTMDKVKFYGSKTIAFDRESQIEVQRGSNDSIVTGSVDAKKDGYVLLPVPVQNGWKLTVDGEDAKILRGDYGFITFAVDQGEHDFELTFEAPMFRMGMMVTAGACGLYVAAFIFCLFAGLLRRSKRRVQRRRDRRSAKNGDVPMTEEPVNEMPEHTDTEE